MTPPDKGKSLGSPDQWMAHAESDLRLACLGQKEKSILAEQICFHAQQAAEKALKAVLLSNNINFPLTHDIEELLGIAEKSGIDLPLEISEASQLTPYAVQTRYPGCMEEIATDEVNEAITLAKQVVTWAKTFL